MLEQEAKHLHDYTNQICLTSESVVNQTGLLLRGEACGDLELEAGAASGATTQEEKRWAPPGLLHAEQSKVLEGSCQPSTELVAMVPVGLHEDVSVHSNTIFTQFQISKCVLSVVGSFSCFAHPY